MLGMLTTGSKSWESYVPMRCSRSRNSDVCCEHLNALSDRRHQDTSKAQRTPAGSYPITTGSELGRPIRRHSVCRLSAIVYYYDDNAGITCTLHGRCARVSGCQEARLHLAGLWRSLHGVVRSGISVICFGASLPRHESAHEAGRQCLYGDAMVRVLRCLLRGRFVGMRLGPELRVRLKRLPARHDTEL